MMKLEQLLVNIEYECVQGSTDVEVENLANDSRKAGKGSLFFCIKGAASDGHKFIHDVVSSGAKVLVVQDDVKTDGDVTIIRVPDTRYAMALMSAAYFGYPAKKLRIIGVTGTKGKTMTCYMIKSILESAGYKTGLIGTIETLIGDESIPAHNTTPESYTIQEYLCRMVKKGIEVAVMEVSSQGLKLDRTAGISFEIGVFTNIEPDHIGPAEHESFHEYLECKSRLFRQCETGIMNADDGHLNDILNGHTCNVETFGLSENADIRAEDIRLVSGQNYAGSSFKVFNGKSYMFDADICIPGRFSVYNSLAAIAVCRHFNVSAENIQSALKTVKVKGRTEIVSVSDKYTLMIDYAHNAMALKSLLETLGKYHPNRLICLFGCGGNRSRLRRFEMGEISGRLADITVITSDNPRYEEPDEIIADIVAGIKKTDGAYVTIPDRREAIRWVLHHAQAHDIVVLAGKGHEDYQEIRGVFYPMDERVLIREILEEDKKNAVAEYEGDR